MRAGILGCGSIGSRHGRNLRKLGLEEIVVCDADRKRADDLAREISAEAAISPAEFWEKRCDLVLIATGTASHAALIGEAVRHGCHLFVEKPVSHTLDGLAEIENEARRKSLVTMVACNMRFHPGPAAIREMAVNGAIGRVFSHRFHVGAWLPGWQPGRDFRESYSAHEEHGGIILDAIHEIDLALWIGGGARVIGAAAQQAVSLGLKTDGLCEILLRHDSGAISSVHMNFLQRDYHRSCIALGEEGSLYWNFATPGIMHFGPDGTLVPAAATPEAFDLNAMYLAEMRHFLACVREGTPTVNPLSGGRAALEVALAARNRPDLYHGDRA